MNVFKILLSAYLIAPISIAAAATELAVVGGTIIDGNGGAPVSDGVILINGSRIVAVGDKHTKIPPSAKRVNAAGKFVIPGLMDANVHLVLDFYPDTLLKYEGRYNELAIEAAQVTLRAGVTTVFDSWGPRADLVAARDAINAGKSIGSRVYVAGNIVGLGGPYSEDYITAPNEVIFEAFTDRINAHWQENVGPELMWMSPEQVRTQIRKYIGMHIDFLKYAVNGHHNEQFIAFSPRVQKVFVEEAHRAGIPVETHTTSGEGLYLAVEAGVDLMQHCEQTAGPERTPPETIQLIVDRHIPCALLAMSDKSLAWYREQSKTKSYMKRWLVSDDNSRALIKAGATILLSTDGGIFSQDHLNSASWKESSPPTDLLTLLGEGHLVWLRAVIEKGMTPMNALMAATRNIARAYKVDRDLGTLENGKIADLVVLDKDPLADSANYGTVSTVIKAGNIVDRASLPSQRLLTVAETPPGGS